MGKREFLIVLVFLVLGGVVYQVTAPRGEPSANQRGWREVLRHVRGEMFGRRVRHPAEREVAQVVPGGTKTLAIGQFGGRVEITGEDRNSVEGRIRVTLLGENEQDVNGAAAALAVELVPDGDVLRLKLTHPDEWRLGPRERPAADITLRVPAQLAVELGVSGSTEISGVSAVALEGARGNVRLRDIAGAVRVDHRDGNLEISGARELSLEARRVTARLEGIPGKVEVESIDGSVTAKGLAGTTRLDTRRAAVDLDGQAGAIEIEAVDGRVAIRGLAAPLDFNGTRLPVGIEMARAVAVTVETEEGPVDLTLPRDAVALTISTDEGNVRLPDGFPAPKREGTRTTLEVSPGGGGPVVSVTGRRADVTVRKP